MERNNIKITAIDDKKDNLISLEAIIKDMFPDSIVFTAPNGSLGIEIASAEDPDVILLDIVMPDMDGFEVCELLKKNEKTRDIPVIFLTALKGDKENRIKALEAGAEAFLSKPIDETELTAQIRAMVKIKAANLRKRNEKEYLEKLVAERTSELEQSRTATFNLLDDLKAEIEIRKKTETKLIKSEEKFRTLITQMQSGLAVHEIILDEKGTPVDYLFLDVNPSFERLTDLKRDDIIGKTVLEILPKTEKIWIERYGHVALTGEPDSFENYSSELDRYYSVVAYRPKKMQFAVVIEDVTDRKQAEKELEKNRKFLAAIIENSGALIFVKDLEGKYLLVNSRWQKVTGLSREKTIGRSNLELFPGSIGKQFHDNDLSVIKSQKLQEFEEVLEQNGSLQYFHSIKFPMRDELGNITGTCGMSTEITDWKNAEKALRESEEKYRLIAENMGNVVTVLDMDLNYTYVSPNIEKSVGFSVDEYLKRKINQSITPESLQLVMKLFEEEMSIEMTGSADPKRSRVVELEEYCKDGSTVWNENIISFIRDENGLPVSVLSVSRDVTEKRKTEKAIRESEIQYRNLANTGLALVWTSGTDKLCNYFNKIWMEFTGRSLEQEIGNGWTEGIHPDDFSRCLETYATAFDKRETFQMEYRLRHASGEYRNILDIGSPNFNSKEEFVGYIGHCFDITDQKLAETEKEKLKDQLAQAQKMESIGRLAGGVAHDFNNMLSVIIGRTELAMMKTDPKTPVFEELDKIKNAAERSSKLTGQLLAFARKQVITPKVVSLNDELGKIFEMLKRLIGENIKLSWKKGKNLWNIRIDPAQIDQIVTNLCINSKDAIEGAGRIVMETENVTITQENLADLPGINTGDFVILKVSDSGSGMDDETVKHIFEPFFTTKNIGKGTGLGLATVFGIVKQNQGFIYVESKLGNGTVFKIYMPRQIEKITSPAKEKSADSSTFGEQTILFVEDEPAILEMGELMLQNFGYTVVTANSPQEAIEKAVKYSGNIDLLITDVIMPEMNGRELSKKIIALYPEIKCLFMSGYTADIIAHQGVVNEGMNFIQKPFSINNLSTTVKKLLAGEKNEKKDY
ncbi:MAG TPA: PAS domain S-box protein [bacterium]|nr:PAS domain S-box protein [bacterium]